MKELENLLRIMMSDIEATKASLLVQSRQSFEIYESPYILDLTSGGISPTIEGRRKIESLLVEVRRFFDKIFYTFCESKYPQIITSDNCHHIEFPFKKEDNKKYFKKLNLPIDFEKTEVYKLIEDLGNKPEEVQKSIDCMVEIHRKSHRGLTGINLTSNFHFDFGGLHFSPHTNITNASVSNGSDGFVILNKCEEIGDDKFLLDFTKFSGSNPRLQIENRLFYKDKSVISLLEELSELIVKTVEAVKKSI